MAYEIVYHHRFSYDLYFPAYQQIPRNLLGRQGFLQRLRFGLDDYEGFVYLSHHDDL